MSGTVCVVDIEITGLDPAAERIVEIAFVGVGFEGRRYRKLFHSLTDPGIPIPPKTFVVHRIPTAMASSLSSLLPLPHPDIIRTMAKIAPCSGSISLLAGYQTICEMKIPRSFRIAGSPTCGPEAQRPPRFALARIWLVRSKALFLALSLVL